MVLRVLRALALIVFMTILLISVSPPQTIASSTHTLTGPVGVLWETRYDGGSEGGPVDVAIDRAGNVYVAGASCNYPVSCDYAVVKYDAQGHQQWGATYDGPGNGNDTPVAIRADMQGDVYVTGHSGGGLPSEGGTHFDIATVKYDGSTGQTLWVARHDATHGQDTAGSIAIDATGNVYVAGESNNGRPTWHDYVVIKYDFNGVKQWAAFYNGPPHKDDQATAIALDADGNAYVAGWSIGEADPVECGGHNVDYATVKYSPNGIEQWVVRYDGPAGVQDRANALAVDGSGNVYVTGASFSRDQACSSTSPADYATIKYDPNGNELWVRRHSRASNSIEWAKALAVDQAGSVYVSGHSGSYFGEDYATIAYSPQGDELWVHYYNGPENDRDFAEAIALDGRGGVYVTGRSMRSYHIDDYATVRYSQDGNEVWVARYDADNGIDQALALAVDGDRNAVYVTGVSDFHGNADFATIKYSNLEFGADEVTLDYIGDLLVLKGSQANMGARLAFIETGEGIRGKQVTFLITDGTNSLSAQGTTGSDGVATATVTVDLPVGLYTVTASLSGEGVPHITSLPLDFTVYEPTEGMSTSGGGIIKDDTLDLKTFAFRTRYLKNQETPTGNLRFRDFSDEVHVTSSEIEWFVVSGDRARFGGTCTVNGDTCTFAVEVKAGGPGDGSFGIGLSTGYSASGVIKGGQIIVQETG